MTHLTGCPRTLAALILSHKHRAIYYYSVMLQQQILRRSEVWLVFCASCHKWDMARLAKIKPYWPTRWPA